METWDVRMCGEWTRVSAELRLQHSEPPVTSSLSLFPISTLALCPQLDQMRFDLVFLGFTMESLARKEAVKGEAKMAALWVGFGALQDPSLPRVFLHVPHPMLCW